MDQSSCCKSTNEMFWPVAMISSDTDTDRATLGLNLALLLLLSSDRTLRSSSALEKSKKQKRHGGNWMRQCVIPRMENSLTSMSKMRHFLTMGDRYGRNVEHSSSSWNETTEPSWNSLSMVVASGELPAIFCMRDNRKSRRRPLNLPAMDWFDRKWDGMSK